MTELVDRMTRLADAAVGDNRLADPSASVAVDGRRPGRPWLGLGAAAALLALVAVAAVLVVGRDDEGPVTAGPSTTAADPSSTTVPLPDPVLSVAFDHPYGPPLGIAVTVRDGTGAVVAERASSEVEEPLAGGRVAVSSGLVVDLPGAGEYRVDLAAPGSLSTCELGPLDLGYRLILRVDVEGTPTCGAVESVEEWAGDSTDVGQRLLGLTEAEAGRQAAADGYDTRVTGRDGIGLAITADLRPDRLDLRVFDGVVVAASGVGETIHGEPRVTEPLAVVITSTDGPLTGSGTVLVVVGDEGVEREWRPAPDDDTSTSVLIDDLPPGPATLELQGQACTMSFDLAATGTVVTVAVPPDGSPDGGECQAMVDPLDQHIATIVEGWGDYDRPEGYIGVTEDEARQRAEAEGLTVRVIARDGRSGAHTDDLRTDRVNLILYDDEVRAAALF